ncbi:MAG: response regulator [Gammaproteobacteria bacterium]|nr:response regulator [Gammaproteobacteria bacterium]
MDAEATTTAAHGRRVLYADGDEAARRAVAAWLETAGYEAVSAADGVSALARMAEDRIDVAVLHSQAPRLDGYRTCALVKRHPTLGHVPVIMVVSDADLYAPAEARVVGACRCLSLPLTEADLLAAVRESLNEGRSLGEVGRGATSATAWMEHHGSEP